MVVKKQKKALEIGLFLSRYGFCKIGLTNPMYMKRSITLFFLLAVISLVSGQNPKKESQRVPVQKTTSTQVAPTKAAAQKNQVLKDSIKRNKLVVEVQEKKIDSLVNVLEIFKPFKKAVHASYYADKFTGRKTSSGAKFDNNKYTAAHKKLPFGTKVRVINEKNGKSVVVEITDRGPFVKSREIDLSKRAYMEITSNKGSGGMLVTIEVMDN